MMENGEASDRGLSLEDRRAFMKLPIEERRRRMSEQAPAMSQHYQAPAEAAEREQWQGLS
jgi:hypothetical protein